MKTKQFLLVPCSLVGILGACSVALAAEGTVTLEEIIVTAQKRSESLQDVPVAVSAFTDESRDLIGIQSIQDFTNFTPGVTYSTSTDRMNVRGIGRYTNNLSTSPGVATYGDGFYNYSNHQADTSALFTERVEILRGPQGTLYGRNSIGGAINVLLKRPTEAFEGEVRAAAGSQQMQRVEALFRGPIGDSVGFLIGGGLYKQEEGWVQNIIGEDEEGNQDEQYAVAQLSVRFGDAADVWLKYAYANWDNGWGSNVLITPYNTLVSTATLVNTGSLGPSALYNSGPAPMRPTPEPYLTANPGATNHRQVLHDTSGHEILDPDHQVVLEANFHFGGADLKYIGGYHEYDYHLTTDFDNSDRKSYQYIPTSAVGTPVRIETQVVSHYNESKQYYSNELNLTSTGDGKLQWILGAYQYDEDYQQPVFVGTPAQALLATPLLPPVFPATLPTIPALANPDRNYSFTDAQINVTSVAGFGQVDYNFTDQWKGTIGLRYTEDKKEGDEFARYISWNPTQFGGLTPALDVSGAVFAPVGGVLQPDGKYKRHLENSSNATTGTAGVEFRPSEDGLGYLKFSRGYKDAAINSGSFAASPYAEPEFVDAYELGWKQELGGRFQANASLFFYDYTDAQIPLSIVRPGLPNQAVTANLNEEIMGVELETVWRATDALQVLLNYSWLDPKITDTGCYSDALDPVRVGPNLCPTGGHSVDDNRVPYQPRNKVAVNGLYTLSFAPGGLTLSASWLWRDTQYSSIFNRAEYLLPSYDQTDLRGTWTSSSGSYSLIGYVRNVFDDEGFDNVGASATASGISQTYSLTPPRQYGLEFQYRFGM